nr:PREDICTED: uncharacterized protein LOC109041629 [Bemisia tabaci]
MVKVTRKLKCNCSIKELKETLNDILLPYMKHSYRVYHQLTFSKDMKEKLNEDEVLIIIDFSENYQLKFTSEVQSCHFGASNAQLTLQTGAYYTNDKKSTTCTSFCSVAQSPRHDAAAIWGHLLPVFSKIKNEHPRVKKAHVLSDGPTKQYRNKFQIHLFGHYMKQLGFELASYNFSEAGHGKSVADGVGGTVKRTADSAVRRGKDVPDIETFVQVLENLKIQVFQIENSLIEEVAKVLENMSLTTIPGTMALHQIVLDCKNEKRLNIRQFSCLICRNKLECTHYPKGSTIFDQQIEQKAPNSENAAVKVNKPAAIKKKAQSKSEATKENSDSNLKTLHDVDERELKVDTYVSVIFDEEWYPGRINSVDLAVKKAKISFMRRSGGFFLWPSTADIHVVNFDGILTILKPPTKCSSRLYVFENVDLVDKLSTSYLRDL